MKSTRDGIAISMKVTDAMSIANSTVSQISEPRSEKNINSDINTGKLSLIIEGANETIAENNARAKEFAEIFNLLDLDTKSMPKDIQDSLTKVSAILRAEGLSEIDETSLILHMERKKREMGKKAREERKLKLKYNKLCDAYSAVLAKQNIVQNDVLSMQEIVETAENSSKDDFANRVFMATKLNDYRQTKDGIEENLKEIGVREEYYPEKLLEKYEAYLEVMEELKEMDNTLSKYGELPPNLVEARIMVEEKERYLENLNRALYEKMK